VGALRPEKPGVESSILSLATIFFAGRGTILPGLYNSREFPATVALAGPPKT